ncbi:MAG: hybrid sensor histidine kinase/response regulator, partial [Spirochaetota bacterium]
RVMTVVGVHTDITELRRHEEELKKMDKLKSIGTLAGGIAHDFNNIMSGVFGNISIARIYLDRDHPSYSFLEEAERSMERATLLTRQLLTFSRGGDPIKEEVSIERLVNEVVRFDLSGSNVKPVFNVDNDLWLVQVDTGQMQQVFSNLTINADQAMPEGGHLYVTLQNEEVKDTALNLAPGKYVKAIIRDEGSGIDEKHLDRIFDPYFSTKQTGSGLGLATVYSIIDKHGGHISVSSEHGSGAAFTLYLPARQPAVRTEKHYPEDSNSIIDFPAKILVVDDEQMIREIASKMLEEAGCQVETAADGKEAIEKYKESMYSENHFDLVIMDLTIPGGMGGEEAIKKLLELDPNAKAIVSSGYSHGALQSRYTEYGFAGMVSKPYSMESLLKVVRQILAE